MAAADVERDVGYGPRVRGLWSSDVSGHSGPAAAAANRSAAHSAAWNTPTNGSGPRDGTPVDLL